MENLIVSQYFLKDKTIIMSNQYIRKDGGPAVLRWVKASERYPSRPGDYNARYALNRCVADFTNGQFISINFRSPSSPIKKDDVNLEYLEWLEEIPSTEPIEEDGKLPDPWFILKYVKTVLERGFPVGDIIELIRKKLHEYSFAASIPLKTTSIEEDGSEAFEKWLNDPQAQLKNMPEIRRAHDGWNRVANQLSDQYEKELAAKDIQIASLEAANKELGEQYAKASRTIDIYLNALEDIASGALFAQLIAQQAIERQYSSL